jgi:hypothetical protein
MYKVVCTNDKEKRQWVEASEKLNKMRDSLDQTSPVIRFLISLYREPGEIEVYEDGLLIRRPTRTFRPKRNDNRRMS